MKVFVYTHGPVDQWGGWLNEDELEARYPHPNEHWDMDYYLSFRDLSFSVARGRGWWEGDITQGPMITGLPPIDGDHDSAFMIGWKQSNNGTTFFASPIALPWLRKNSFMPAQIAVLKTRQRK